ncbi:MAG: hypothetical protein IKX45_06110 [Bacteroidales bacterium]|nr:hypothetical protein [Bacteroidales bacterium]
MEEIVDGISTFRKAFTPFAESFIVIGGCACRAVIPDGDIRPRKTTDIDMVLVPQELSPGFISTFWKFIKDGEYKFASRKDKEGDRRYVFYSFIDGKEGYPDQIELLSKPDESIGTPAEHHIEYIDTGEEYSHLSAIILDRNYYDYLASHFETVDGIRYASADALVFLKALAYLNLTADKRDGKRVNDDDIKKHRRDVIMAAAYLPIGEKYTVGESLRQTLDDFLLAVADSSVRQSLKASLGIDDAVLDSLLGILKDSFVR